MPRAAKDFGNEVATRISEIGKFVETTEFQMLLSELRAVPVEDKVRFVENVVLNGNELTRRNINIPEGMAIQRSYFADNRPTLFCVTQKLTNKQWKVTITFDNEGQSGSIPLAHPPEQRT